MTGHMVKLVCILILSIFFISPPAFSQAKHYKPNLVKKKKHARIQYGTASFYHNKFGGRKTANGELFSQNQFTAAHNNVPLGTLIRVTNLRNHKRVIVEVTDRLHRRNKRLIDLSKSAASKIGFSSAGLLPVKIEVLGKAMVQAKRK